MRTDLTVPEVLKDLGAAPLADLWDLEDWVEDAREQISAEIDRRIKLRLDEGWSQAAIADECRRDQSRISRRMKRLGLEPANETGRPRELCGRITPTLGPEPEDAEVVTGEPVMTNDLAPTRSWKRNPADQIDDIVTRVEGFTSVLGRRREGETKDQLIDVDAAIEASDITTLREWDTKLTDAIRRLTRLRAGVRGKI